MSIYTITLKRELFSGDESRGEAEAIGQTNWPSEIPQDSHSTKVKHLSSSKPERLNEVSSSSLSPSIGKEDKENSEKPANRSK